MTHLVFQPADAEVLRQAAALEGGAELQGDYVVIEDDFMLGPLENLYQPEGYQARRDWQKNILEDSPYEQQIHLVNDKLKVHNLLKKLNEGETLWIWMAQNPHDVTAYYWLIPQLAKYQGQVHVLYLNNLPFFNEKGSIFYPAYLMQIPPKEFLKARKLARPVTGSEFEVDSDETQRLMGEGSMVRLLEGGKKLAGKPVSYFDDWLLAIVRESGPIRWGKLFTELFKRSKLHVGDVFIMSRLKALSAQGLIAMQGEVGSDWKDRAFSNKTGAADGGSQPV